MVSYYWLLVKLLLQITIVVIAGFYCLLPWLLLCITMAITMYCYSYYYVLLLYVIIFCEINILWSDCNCNYNVDTHHSLTLRGFDPQQTTPFVKDIAAMDVCICIL